MKKSSNKKHFKRNFGKAFVRTVSPIILAAVASLFPAAVPDAMAKVTTTQIPNGQLVTVDSSAPNPWTSTIGTGRNASPQPPNTVYVLQVASGGAISVTNANAISLGNNTTINIDGTVTGNSSYGGLYGTGPNVIEANSHTTIQVNLGGVVQQIGPTTNGEAINLHGFANTVTNYGLISAKNAAAIWFQDESSSGGDQSQRNVVTNYGTIQTEVTGGSVIGTSAGNGIVFYNKSGGIVNGNLIFSQGNDDLYFEAGSIVNGNINGGGGTNNLLLDGDASLGVGVLNGYIQNFQTLTKIGTGTWAITGQLQGFRTTEVDEGILRILGNNSGYTGTLLINQNGIVEARAQSLPSNGPTGTNNSNLTNNGTLRFVQGVGYNPNTGLPTGSDDPTDTGTYYGQIVGTGHVEVDGPGTVILAPTNASGNTYSGGTIVKRGTLGVGADNALGAVSGGLILGSVGNVGTLRLQNSFNLNSSRTVQLAGAGGAIDTQSYTTTISQAFQAGSTNLYKKGSGTLILTGNSGIAGIANVQQGTLQLGAGGTTGSLQILSNRYIQVDNGAALAFNRSDSVTSDTLITGAGRVIQRGTGTLSLTNRTNSFTGGTEIESGTINITDAFAYGRTAGTTNNAGHITYTGADVPKTVNVAAGIGNLTNQIRAEAGKQNEFNTSDNLAFTGVNNGSTDHAGGGAFYVATGSELTVNLGGDLTLGGNSAAGTANDIYVASGGTFTLDTKIGKNASITSGIDGTGTVDFKGTGIVDLAATSQAGTTNVFEGTTLNLNLDATKKYTNTDSFNLAKGGTLRGYGELASGSNTLSGIVAPSGTSSNVGTIKISSGNTTLASTFQYQYNVIAPNSTAVIRSNVTDMEKDPSNTQNDLIQFGSQTVTINGGYINAYTAQDSDGKYLPAVNGRYLLFDSSGAKFVKADGTALTDADLNSLFTSTLNGQDVMLSTPRRDFAYYFDNQSGMPANSQIWAELAQNSLTMDWTGDSIWYYGRSQWQSEQTTPDGIWESQFQDGDKVHFYSSAPGTLTVTVSAPGPRGVEMITSGMVVGEKSDGTPFNGNVTITGLSGITADKNSAYGIYAEGIGTPKLEATGKLQKYGDGTLTFSNIGVNDGGNMFKSGVDLHGGITAFNQANQLAVGTDAAIMFVENSTLQPNASFDFTTPIIINNGKTGTINVDQYVDTDGITKPIGLFLLGNLNGPGNLVKTGEGVLQFADDVGKTSPIANTTVTAGKFRIVGVSDTNRKTYNSTGMFTLNKEAELSGGGIVIAGDFDISGKIASDHAVMTPINMVVTGTDRIATLTLQGTDVNASVATFYSDIVGTEREGFSFDYRVTSRNMSADPTVTPNDLLAIRNIDEVHLQGGVINVMTDGASLTSGAYLIIDSDKSIYNLSNDPFSNAVGNKIDGINNRDPGDQGAMWGKINDQDIASDGPRGQFTFELRNRSGMPEYSQLWLTVDRNTLQTNWQGGDGVWSTGKLDGSTAAGWKSEQYTGLPGSEVYDNNFYDGDLVYFSGSSDYTVTVDRNVVVSGMVGGLNSAGTVGDNNVTIKGPGGITAIQYNRTGENYIEGDYANLIPGKDGQGFLTTGKLEKYGSGTLTFDNGDHTLSGFHANPINTFNEGIDIYAGTVAYSSGQQLIVGSGKSITFKDNATLQATGLSRLNTNIVSEAGFTGSLRADEGVVMILNATVSGAGNITKTGTGTLQNVADSSTVLGEMTTISAGTWRMIAGSKYGTTKLLVDTNGTLAGGGLGTHGIVNVNAATIKGTISPDGYEDTISGTPIGDKIGTLVLQGIGTNPTTVLDGFTFKYDAVAPNTTTDYQNTPNDLLSILGVSTITLNSGVIDISPSGTYLESGKYLIIHADNTINVAGGNDNTNLNAKLKGKIDGTEIESLSPRVWYLFRFNDETLGPGSNESTTQYSQIWLDAELNSLTMDWTATSGSVWNAKDGQFLSLQEGSAPSKTRETIFRDGDKVHISNTDTATAVEVVVNDDVHNPLVSGLVVGMKSDDTTVANGNVKISGTGSITSRTPKATGETDIIGRYLPPPDGSATPTLTPTGMLQKYGSGTLTIENTGGNSFEKGTVISQGTIVVGDEKALGVFTGSLSADGTVTFDANDEVKTISIAENVASVKNRFIVNGTKSTLENNGDVEISGIASGAEGGAIYLSGDRQTELTIDAKDGNFTFKDNTEAIPNNAYNDIRVDGDSTLNLTGKHHIFLNSGIAGTVVGGNIPTVNVTGTGDARTQVSGISNFNGVTNITSGGLRVKSGVTYGGTDNISVTVAGTSDTVTASLEGGGTVLTNSFIAGQYSVISPDSYDLSDPTTIADGQVGRLTIQGTGTNPTAALDGFTMDYDTVAPNGTNNNPTNTQNDLLRFTGMDTVTVTSGTINFRGSFTSGDYLIVDAYQTSIGTDGKPIDAIDNPNGVLKATYMGNAITNSTPRSTSQFELRDYDATNSQIWYTIERNTLTMNRSMSGDWFDANWKSTQYEPASATTPPGDDDNYEHSFQNGDFVNLTANAGNNVFISVNSNAIVSGLNVDSEGNLLISGSAGIRSTTSDPTIEGIYINDPSWTNDRNIIPTGELVKTGNGVLNFRNTGGNDFEEGVFIDAGTIAINLANQLGGRGLISDNTFAQGNKITFRGDGELRTDDNLTLYNAVQINDGVAATFNTSEDTELKYYGNLTNPGTANLIKDGLGTLSLYNQTSRNNDGSVNSLPSDYSGSVTVAAGKLAVYGDYRKTNSFAVQSGGILSGTGHIGSQSGGVIESGGTLAPGGLSRYDANSPNQAPVENPLTVHGNLTFEAGSNFDVRITQYGKDPTTGKYNPYSDRVDVTDGGVATIADGQANLNVEFDYWGGQISIYNFNAEESTKFTVIDATAGDTANSTAEFKLTLSNILPRGVKIAQGWQNYEDGWMGFDPGWLYQLWFEGDPDNGFQNICDHHNRIEIGANLDQLILENDPALKDLIDQLSDPSLSNKDVCDILDWIHGDLTPNSMMMAMKQPWRHPFNRLSLDSKTYCDPCGPIASKNRFKRQLWGEFYGRYDDVRSDNNAHPFTINRLGVVVGMDQKLSKRSILGLAFNYSDPHLRQMTGKTEMDDYEIGIYNLTRLNDQYEMKFYLGYSHQRYDINRHVYIRPTERFAAISERFRNKTDGNALAASIELTRPIQFRKNVKFLPTIAFDFEQAWMKGYRESGGLTALEYDNSTLERMMLRFGLASEIGIRNNLDLKARIQYATQLNGTEYARTGVRFVNATSTDQRTADIWGSRIGRDYLNLGIGADWRVNQLRNVSLFINYDADLYKRATTHAGEFGLTKQW